VLSDEFARLEKLVDRLLGEREEILQRNADLAGERDQLYRERARVSAELDRLLVKLERLDRKKA
jgi:hypothetical protein